MIGPAGAPFALAPFAQDAAQPSANPRVQFREDVGDTVLEVPYPAAQGSIDFPHKVGDRTGPVPLRLDADRFLELVQALLARPTVASLEVVAQKVEAAPLAGVDDARFGRVQ